MLGVDSGLVLEEEEGEEEEEEEKERIGIGSDVIRTFEVGKWKAEERVNQKKKRERETEGKRRTLERGGSGRRRGMQNLVVAAGGMVVEGMMNRGRWSARGGIVFEIEFPERGVGRVGLWIGSHGCGRSHDGSKRG